MRIVFLILYLTSVSVYTQQDSTYVLCNAAFKGDVPTLIKHFEDNLYTELYPDLDDSIQVSFFVKGDGSIAEIELDYFPSVLPKDTLQQAVFSMNGWNPALDHRYHVIEDRVTIRIGLANGGISALTVTNFLLQ